MTRPSTSGITLVLGLGRFGGGSATVRYLAQRHQGDRPTIRIADRASAKDLRETVLGLADVPEHALEWRLGEEGSQLLEGVHRVVLNPAIPDQHPLVHAARKRGIAMTQEVELFLKAYPGRVVVVTGTNGKSTTATMLAAALGACGVDTLLGGNIGRSLLADEARFAAEQVAVLELSSFQLERLDPATVPVVGAVLTRMGEDHLDRHGDTTRYWQAKAVAAAMAQSFLVHQADDPVAAAFASPASQRIALPSIQTIDGFFRDPWPEAKRGWHPVHANALVQRGKFQGENAWSAMAAARLLDTDSAAAGLAIACCKPLPHRLQSIAEICGVRIWDNAISTQADSTVAALRALADELPQTSPTAKIHWVGGGKHDPRTPCVELVADVAHHCASAHVFGEAAAPLANASKLASLPCTAHDAVESALTAAFDAARPGDAIVFSPAHKSFDRYPNFKERAAALHRWVAQVDLRNWNRPAGSESRA